MKHVVASVLCTLAVFGMIACNQSKPVQQAEKQSFPKHVILVGFDGFSAHCVKQGAALPTLRRLMAEGSYTLDNRSVLPSSSAVNWASMFMGAGPELHGYTDWGSRTPELPSRVLNADNRFPNIFGLYRDKVPEAEIGYIYEWEGMNYLVDTLAMNFRQQVAMNAENPDGCTPVAVQYIKEKKPNLCAIIFDQPDGTGHKSGWSSPEYIDMVNHLDSCLAQIVDAIKEAGIMDETVLIVTSDHGGFENGHGGKAIQEIQTPVVFYGKGVRKGHLITESTMIYDVAGTMAYLLQVEQPQVWIARPILSAFQK